MRSARRPSTLSKPGVWLALAAVLTLFASPLTMGRARAEPSRMAAMPAAGAAGAAMSMNGPATAGVDRAPCRTCHDPLCAATCALSAQLMTVRAEPAAAPRRRAATVAYAALHLQPAGLQPQQGTPPPR